MTADLPRLAVDATLAVIRAHLLPGQTKWAILKKYRLTVTKPALETFATHGTTCRGCGLEASYFLIEPHPNPEMSSHSHTLRLYGEHAGEPVLFTQDHTIARCLGGSDDLFNRAPMCFACNQAKAEAEKMVCHDQETPIMARKSHAKKARPRKTREKVLLWNGKGSGRRLSEAHGGSAWW